MALFPMVIGGGSTQIPYAAASVTNKPNIFRVGNTSSYTTTGDLIITIDGYSIQRPNTSGNVYLTTPVNCTVKVRAIRDSNEWTTMTLTANTKTTLYTNSSQACPVEVEIYPL